MPRTGTKTGNDHLDTELRIPLSGVLYREDEWWIAHCLQLDIAAEGDTRADALDNVLGLIDLQLRTAIEDGDIKSAFRPAPPELWKMFWVGSDVKFSRKKVKRPIERFDARELQFA